MLKRFYCLLVLLTTVALCGCSGGGGAGGPAFPATLEYSDPLVSYVAGEAIPENRPSYSGPTIAHYSVLPALPNGLGIDPATGVISGTPTTPTALNSYVVTGEHAQGSIQAVVRIEVVDAVEPVVNLEYSDANPVYSVGTQIQENTPHHSGGAVQKYSISPSLPQGLDLDPQSGVISGTPAVASGQTDYTVTAFAQRALRADDPKNGTVHLTITVKEAPLPAPTDLSYTQSWAVYATGRPILPNFAHHDGGDVDHYYATPPLPAGLSIDPANGNIVGTPTAATGSGSGSAGVYEIVAAGPGGAASTQVSIAVVPPGTWVAPPGQMAAPRYGFAQVALPDGRVLIAGGVSDLSNVAESTLATAELYDPNTGAFSPAGSMAGARYGAMAQLLPDGRVLVAGGYGPNGVLATAEVFDPKSLNATLSGSPWQVAGSMGTARAGASIALMSQGDVLVAGGSGANSVVLQSTEIFDPQSGLWSPGAPLRTSAKFATALPMQDGAQIVIPGGRDNSGNVSAVAQISTGSGSPWSNNVRLSNGPRAQYGAFVVSPNVALIFGGTDASFRSLATIDQYDASAQSWTPVPATLSVGRSAPLVAPLDGNRVLVAGGKAGAASGIGIKNSEILTVSPTGAVADITDAVTAPMNLIRVEGGVSALPDGNALVVGGWDNTNGSPGTVWNTAEIYVP